MSGFVISLDFELAWGIFEHNMPAAYFAATQESVPGVLQRFANREIAATWACVGMLFHQGWDEWLARRPESLPTYERSDVSSYAFGNQARDKIAEHCFFASSLIRRIQQTPKQEMASHTYSHFYCLEPGQTVEQFSADLRLAIEIARQQGMSLESLVFPRNQFRPEYLRACREQGITSVRTNPDVWYWKKPNTGFLNRIARTADCYLPFRHKSVPPKSIVEQEGVLLQPASRLLRPHDSSYMGPLLNWARTQRIKNEMTRAARQKLVYHLWWHPHNFAADPDASLKNLDEILEHFQRLRDKYEFPSHSMKSLRAALVSKSVSG